MWFLSQAGRTYYMQFMDGQASENDADWQTVLLPITGTGYNILWFDDGPPKTQSTPSTPPSLLGGWELEIGNVALRPRSATVARFYRLRMR